MVVIVLPVYVFLVPGSRRVPMSDRTIEAIKAARNYQSAATQAALEASIERDTRRNHQQRFLAFSAVLVLNAVLTYFLWNYGKREHPA